jgi:hypothetical protein
MLVAAMSQRYTTSAFAGIHGVRKQMQLHNSVCWKLCCCTSMQPYLEQQQLVE